MRRDAGARDPGYLARGPDEASAVRRRSKLKLASELGATPGQVALAWLLAQGQDIVPIPGTKRSERLMDNLGALAVHLSPEDVAKITAAVPPGSVAGTRYSEAQLKAVYL